MGNGLSGGPSARASARGVRGRMGWGNASGLRPRISPVITQHVGRMREEEEEEGKLRYGEVFCAWPGWEREEQGNGRRSGPGAGDGGTRNHCQLQDILRTPLRRPDPEPA